MVQKGKSASLCGLRHQLDEQLSGVAEIPEIQPKKYQLSVCLLLRGTLAGPWIWDGDDASPPSDVSSIMRFGEGGFNR